MVALDFPRISHSSRCVILGFSLICISSDLLSHLLSHLQYHLRLVWEYKGFRCLVFLLVAKKSPDNVLPGECIVAVTDYGFNSYNGMSTRRMLNLRLE
jgi:hypothetical protein